MSFSISAVGASSAPQITSGASAYASPAAKMSSLFQQIDSGNSGSISLAQFQHAFAALNPPARFQAQGRMPPSASSTPAERVRCQNPISSAA